MLADKAILIVEDNAYLAMDLVAAVEQYDGRVIGPAGSVAEGLQLAAEQGLAGAVLDYQLPDGPVTPLARLLAARSVPFVIHTEVPVAPELTMIDPSAPVLIKPIQPDDIVSILAHRLLIAEEVRPESPVAPRPSPSQA